MNTASLSGQGFPSADLSGLPQCRGRWRTPVPAGRKELGKKRGEAQVQVSSLAGALEEVLVQAFLGDLEDVSFLSAL
jgi:hypothetical protein